MFDEETFFANKNVIPTLASFLKDDIPEAKTKKILKAIGEGDVAEKDEDIADKIINNYGFFQGYYLGDCTGFGGTAVTAAMYKFVIINRSGGGKDKPTPEKPKLMRWVDALKIFNEGTPKWCVPSRGTPEYEEVMRIRRGEERTPKPEPPVTKTIKKKKEEPKEAPKAEPAIPFYVPKIHPDYDNIPDLPKKGTPEHDKYYPIKYERDRIKRLKEVPEGQERERAELVSFRKALSKWDYVDFISRQEANEMYNQAVRDYNAKYFDKKAKAEEKKSAQSKAKAEFETAKREEVAEPSGLPFFVPKIKPNYKSIPPLPPKSNPHYDDYKKEIERIKRLLEVPEGLEREKAELASFKRQFGKFTFRKPNGDWKWDEFWSGDEAKQELFDGITKYNEKFRKAKKDK
jgi:uncharacterized protein (DUF2164 family)